ncbi:uncharacterized protein LOC134299168 [Anolis carolinensis]|uniref:uncharacterized protein LOC134299168 n=1 Tax=Anolis carolinensis TaxID=28377 RepID=UPI002F2B4CBE
MGTKTAIVRVLLFGLGWLLTVEAQNQEELIAEIQITKHQVEPDGSTSSPKIVDNTLSAAATVSSSSTTTSFLQHLAVLFSKMATEVHLSLFTVPPVSTITAETLPESPILIASTAQPFTSTMTTTTSQLSAKIHPPALTSEVVSTEVHTSNEQTAELHPAMLIPPMVSTELHTNTASVASITNMASAPTTTEARPKIPASPQHLTASEEESAEETSPERTTRVSEAIVAESSIPTTVAKCKTDIPSFSKFFHQKPGDPIGLIALQQLLENMGNLIPNPEITYKLKVKISFPEKEGVLNLGSQQKRSKRSLRVKSRLQKLWSLL